MVRVGACRVPLVGALPPLPDARCTSARCCALVRAPLTPVLPLAAAAPFRASGGGDGNGAGDAEQEEYRAKVLAMQKQAQEEAAAHESEMRKLYGDEDPALNWMHSYLQSPHPQFMVAATTIAGAEDGLSDSVEAAFIHFVAQLLRASEEDGESRRCRPMWQRQWCWQRQL